MTITSITDMSIAEETDRVDLAALEAERQDWLMDATRTTDNHLPTHGPSCAGCADIIRADNTARLNTACATGQPLAPAPDWQWCQSCDRVYKGVPGVTRALCDDCLLQPVKTLCWQCGDLFPAVAGKPATRQPLHCERCQLAGALRATFADGGTVTPSAGERMALLGNHGVSWRNV